MPTTSPLTIPSFPGRPINGGDLMLAQPKIGRWSIEPKYNGWRALVHLPTGTMFNRHGKRLSIEKEFASAIAVLRDALASVADWIDTEALERRHGIGRGTLMAFDFLPLSDRSFIYPERRRHLSALPVLIADEQPANHHAYLVPSWEMQGEKSLHLWHRLQELNRQWNTTGLNSFYEGLVMKRVESPYPLQLRNAEDETHYWMKHRWPVL